MANAYFFNTLPTGITLVLNSGTPYTLTAWLADNDCYRQFPFQPGTARDTFGTVTSIQVIWPGSAATWKVTLDPNITTLDDVQILIFMDGLFCRQGVVLNGFNVTQLPPSVLRVIDREDDCERGL